MEKTALRFYASIVVVVALFGCSKSDASPDQAAAKASTSGSASQTMSSACPSPSDVSTIVGFEVRALTNGQKFGDELTCGYIEAKDDAGTTVTMYDLPPDQADERLNKIRTDVTAINGEGAKVETIPVGERGIAYGSDTKSEAGTTASGRTYVVEISAGALEDHGNKKDAAVALLRRIVNQ